MLPQVLAQGERQLGQQEQNMRRHGRRLFFPEHVYQGQDVGQELPDVLPHEHDQIREGPDHLYPPVDVIGPYR